MNLSELKQSANYYHSLGFNIIATTNKVTIQNFSDNNIFKAPSAEWLNIDERCQTVTELDSINWGESIGVGTILSWNNLCAIDLDGCLD